MQDRAPIEYGTFVPGCSGDYSEYHSQPHSQTQSLGSQRNHSQSQSLHQSIPEPSSIHHSNDTVTHSLSVHLSASQHSKTSNVATSTLTVPLNDHTRTHSSSGRATQIRTDRHTGSRYRRMRSLSGAAFDQGLDYEKEVFSSTNLYTIRPRSDSYSSQLWQSPMRIDTIDGTKSSSFLIISKQELFETKKKQEQQHKVSQEQLLGYSWLGKSSSWKDQVLHAAQNVWHNQAIALCILASIVTILAFIVSELTLYCWKLIDYIYFDSELSSSLILTSLVGLKVAFVFCAIFLTVYIAPQAAGSGIPELKAILSGIWIRRYLSIRVFCVKTFSIICALGSGLPIGIEGPFIHIAAIIGRQLTKLGWFQHIDRKILLSAACACSIAVIFGAPIGGVLFSIEVTHHYYKINSYWSAFLCAVTAAVFTAIVQDLVPTSLLLFHTNFDDAPYVTYEFIVFAIVGVIAGLLGAGYVHFHHWFTRFRSEKLSNFNGGFWNNAYIIAFLVTSTYVFLAFLLGEFASRPARMAINDLFNANSLNDCNDANSDCYYHDWGSNLGVYWNLFFFSLLNYIWSVLFLCLDWPCGCFASVFAIGAASGRLLGEIVSDTIVGATGAKLLASTYAVVGAASLVSGITRTFSIAVIVIEMTFQVRLVVPVLLGVTIAWTIANWLSESLYDSILDLRGIPLLPVQPRESINYKIKPYPRPFIASDVMTIGTENISSLPEKCTIKEIAICLDQFDDVFFPILQGGTHLIGEVSRAVLEDCLKSRGYEQGSDERLKLLVSTNMTRLNDINNNNNINDDNINNHLSDDNLDNIINRDLNMQSINEDMELDINTDLGDDSVYETLLTRDNDSDNNDSDNNSEEDNDDGDDENENENNDDEARLKRMRRKRAKERVKARKQRQREQEEEDMLEWICFTDDHWIEHLNLSPVQVIPHMPLTNIYVLFHVMHPDKIYVTQKNELIGVIDEATLIQRERHRLSNNNGINDNDLDGNADNDLINDVNNLIEDDANGSEIVPMSDISVGKIRNQLGYQPVRVDDGSDISNHSG